MLAGRDFLFTAARAGSGPPHKRLNANNKKKEPWRDRLKRHADRSD
jgi:hypothetical protein